MHLRSRDTPPDLRISEPPIHIPIHIPIGRRKDHRSVPSEFRPKKRYCLVAHKIIPLRQSIGVSLLYPIPYHTIPYHTISALGLYNTNTGSTHSIVYPITSHLEIVTIYYTYTYTIPIPIHTIHTMESPISRKRNRVSRSSRRSSRRRSKSKRDTVYHTTPSKTSTTSDREGQLPPWSPAPLRRSRRPSLSCVVSLDKDKDKEEEVVVPMDIDIDMDSDIDIDTPLSPGINLSSRPGRAY